MKFHKAFGLTLAATAAAFITAPPVGGVELFVSRTFDLLRLSHSKEPIIIAALHGSALGTCPYSAYASIDGCSGASAYLDANLSYQNANLLASAGTAGSIFQTAQTLTSPFHTPSGKINWNVAGLDFPVGIAPGTLSNGVVNNAYCTGAYVSLDNPKLPCSYDTSGNLTPLIDAAKYDWAKDALTGYANAGCASGVNWASGGTYPYSVQCNASSLTNISGFDFGPAEWNGSAYSPVCAGFLLRDNGSATNGTINFKNNRIFWSGDTSCLALTNEYQAGYVVPIYLAVNMAHNWAINVWNNRVDQNAKKAYNTVGDSLFYGYSGPFTVGYVSSSGTVQTAISVKYNYFSNLFYRAVTINYPCGGFEFSDNVIQNIGDYSGGAHGEIYFVQPATSGDLQTEHCPGFVYGAGGAGGSSSPWGLPTTPVASPNGWAGSTWGAMPYFKVVNNVAWTDSTVRGDGTAFISSSITWNNPDLLNIQAGLYELNVFEPNPPQNAPNTPASRFYFMYVGFNAFVPNTSGGSATGYNSNYAANDILSIDVPACEAGGYTSPPTGQVLSLTSVRPADPGNCGYSNPGTSGTVTMTCVHCANEPVGFVTGWTTSGVTFDNINESSLMDIMANHANDNGGLNGGYINYQSLTISNNMLDGAFTYGGIVNEALSGHYNGQFLSCGLSLQLPTGTTYPFYSLGNGGASVSNNFLPNGSAASVEAWAVGNGC